MKIHKYEPLLLRATAIALVFSLGALGLNLYGTYQRRSAHEATASAAKHLASASTRTLPRMPD